MPLLNQPLYGGAVRPTTATNKSVSNPSLSQPIYGGAAKPVSSIPGATGLLGVRPKTPAPPVKPATTLPAGQTAPVDNQKATQEQAIGNQLNNLKSKVSEAQNAGYGANDQIQYDANGNVIKKPTGGNSSSSNGSTGTTPPPPPPTYPGLVGKLADTSSQPSQAYTDAQKAANETLAQEQALRNEYNQKTNNIAGTAGFLTQQTGLQGLLNTNYNTAMAGLEQQYAGNTQQIQNANTQQQVQQQGLLGAAGLAQPQLGQQGQAYYNPLNPGATSGGSIQLSGVAQNDINTLSTAVNNGAINYSDALAQLNSAYGGAVANQLLSAIQKLNPSFSVNASNASQQTTAVGQQLKAAIPPANQALDALQVAFNNLGPLSGSSVPFIQEFAQNAAMQTGIGRTNVSNFQGALQEARARIDAALTGVIGVDAAGKQANALLPDNMTPAELPGKIAAAKQYLQNQLNSYQGSGSQNNSGTSSVQYNSDGTLKSVSF